MFADLCVFDETGQHVYIGQHCPHFDVVDEMGLRIKPGWTVQENGEDSEAG